jgi:hypothetical protein
VGRERNTILDEIAIQHHLPQNPAIDERQGDRMDGIDQVAKHTHYILIQDKQVSGGVKETVAKMNDMVILIGRNGNPGVWYMDDPLAVKVGDVIMSYRVVSIKEYPPQPTLRTLYLVKEDSHES